jgi:beta-N-acetylhexosaminidase
MAIGAAGSEEVAYLMGKITASEARAMGVHLTYSPVVDVNVNPENPIINTRSFGENPAHVTRLAQAYIRGCQENGLLTTAKHFPGHGDTELDSHSLLPTINRDINRLENVELYPFEQVIKTGVSAIMIAHIQLPALDPTPNTPASLSPLIVSELLREKLGFRGIIVTDAMDMGGVTTLYEPEEAAIRAVKAGVDMILLPPNPGEVIDALVNAVSFGYIPETRIDASAKRILRAKARLGLHKNKIVDVNSLDKIIASRKNLEFAAKVFENTVTLVKNDRDILPLGKEQDSQKIAVFSLSSDAGDYFSGRPFINEIEKRCSDVVSFYADLFTGDEFFREGLENAQEADVFVLLLSSSLRSRKGSVGLDMRHLDFVRELIRGSTPTIVVSFGSPYFIRHFPEVDAYLCTYRGSDLAQDVAVKAIFGEIEVRGKLPVSIPGLYEFGHGLTLPKK